jgi:hypothetical protein
MQSATALVDDAEEFRFDLALVLLCAGSSSLYLQAYQQGLRMRLAARPCDGAACSRLHGQTWRWACVTSRRWTSVQWYKTNESEGAMAGDMRELKIQIEPQADADAEELASFATQLRRELDALDVQSVQLERAGEVPEGAKAVEVLALGSLIVKLGPVAVGVVARVVQGWLKRSAARSAELQIDGDVIKLTGTSLQDQERLIALLEAKHGRR